MKQHLYSLLFFPRDGVPYCETDYHAKFGIRCDNCEKYITGRVLEVRRACCSSTSQSIQKEYLLWV